MSEGPPVPPATNLPLKGGCMTSNCLQFQTNNQALIINVHSICVCGKGWLAHANLCCAVNTTPYPVGSSADQIPAKAWAPPPAPIAGSANDRRVASYHGCIDTIPNSHHLVIEMTVTVGDSVILDQLDSQINTHFSCHNICFPSSLYGDHQPTSGSLEYEKLNWVILKLGKLSANQNTQLLKMALFTSRDITGSALSVLLCKIAMTMKNPIDDIPLLFIALRFGMLRGNIVSEPQAAGTAVHPCFAAHFNDLLDSDDDSLSMNILELIVHQNSNNHKQSAPSPSSAQSAVPTQTPIVTHTFHSRPTSVCHEAPSHAPLSTILPNCAPLPSTHASAVIIDLTNNNTPVFSSIVDWANYVQVHGPRETSTIIPWRVRALNVELGALALIAFIEAKHSHTIVDLSGEMFKGAQIGFTPGNDGLDMNLSSLFMANCIFKVAPSGEGIGLGVECAVISRVIKIVLNEHYMWQKLAPNTAASLAALPLNPAQPLDYSLTGPLSLLLVTYSNIQLTALQPTQLPANMSVEQCMELIGQVYANMLLGCPPRAALDMLKEVYYFCQGFDIAFSNDAVSFCDCITSPSQVIEWLEFEVALVRWPDGTEVDVVDSATENAFILCLTHYLQGKGHPNHPLISDCVPESERNSQEGSPTFRAVQLLLSVSGNCCLPTDPMQKIIVHPNSLLTHFCFVKNLPVRHTYVKPARADDSWEMVPSVGTLPGRVLLAKNLVEMLPHELASINQLEEQATEYLHYRQFFMIWDNLDHVIECWSIVVLIMNWDTRAAWLSNYKGLIDQAYDAVMKLLTSDWMMSRRLWFPQANLHSTDILHPQAYTLAACYAYQLYSTHGPAMPSLPGGT
ncbi:uncharacterized protein BJ212DRAFT_1549700 [Suillus subaureus]|uniref:Nuclear pore complex protein n=1 Tax=Suillus subaureus TaxID=48587 RepID=A0A9P7DU37_9AGAM|nr:uncharacterized protein BJ212DRAFT_1549700 [Suillus subaureus]KAG1803245.1 hypothetical protein BJ212DRAFT_1549700 [Suillus subaureus]